MYILQRFVYNSQLFIYDSIQQQDTTLLLLLLYVVEKVKAFRFSLLCELLSFFFSSLFSFLLLEFGKLLETTYSSYLAKAAAAAAAAVDIHYVVYIL